VRLGAHWLPGRCGLLKSPPHTAGLAAGATAVLQVVGEVRFASDDLPSSIVARTLRSAGEQGCSPPCLVRGSGTHGISRKTMRSGWLARTAFVLSGRSSTVNRLLYPILLLRAPARAALCELSWQLCFVFSSPILMALQSGCASGTRRLQLSSQEFWIASEFSKETLRIHNGLRRYSAIRSQQILAGECGFATLPGIV